MSSACCSSCTTRWRTARARSRWPARCSTSRSPVPRARPPPPRRRCDLLSQGRELVTRAGEVLRATRRPPAPSLVRANSSSRRLAFVAAGPRRRAPDPQAARRHDERRGAGRDRRRAAALARAVGPAGRRGHAARADPGEHAGARALRRREPAVRVPVRAAGRAVGSAGPAAVRPRDDGPQQGGRADRRAGRGADPRQSHPARRAPGVHACRWARRRRCCSTPW